MNVPLPTASRPEQSALTKSYHIFFEIVRAAPNNPPSDYVFFFKCLPSPPAETKITSKPNTTPMCI